MKPILGETEVGDAVKGVMARGRQMWLRGRDAIRTIQSYGILDSAGMTFLLVEHSVLANASSG